MICEDCAKFEKTGTNWGACSIDDKKSVAATITGKCEDKEKRV